MTALTPNGPGPDVGDALRSQWENAARNAPSAKAVLESFLKTHLAYLTAHPEAGEALYGGPPEDDGGRYDASVREAVRPLLDAVAAAVERGKAEREFMPDTDPASAAVHFAGLIQMSFVFWTMEGRVDGLDEVGGELFRQFLAGLTA